MIVMFSLILLFGLHRYMIPLHFLAVIYRGFLAGYKIALLTGLYGAGGFFNAVFFVLPFELVFFASLSFVTVCAIDRCLTFGKFGTLLVRILPGVCAVIVFAIFEAILIPSFIPLFG